MPANLSSFQSLVQLAAGINLALFALPSLRQPEIEVEKRRWLSVVGWSQGSEGAAASGAIRAPTIDQRVRMSAMQFEVQVARLEDSVRAVKPYCLVATGLTAVYLLWMSAYPDQNPDFWTFFCLVLALIPASMFARLNALARARLATSRSDRKGFERELEQGSDRDGIDDPQL